MDLRITNYGTDAREYALVSKVSQPHDYSALLAMISLVINTAFCMVVCIMAMPVLRGRMDPKYHEWLPILDADDRHFVTWSILPVLVVIFIVKTSFATKVVEESLLVIPQIGVQLRKKQRNGHETFMFIEATRIKAVVINEAISFSDVIYYLAFLVEDEHKMVLAFEVCRRDCAKH
ncbi:hypothetical protein, variant 1 [Aphanomyces invadans]|uniref:Phosphatidylinositol N-acetylglucosaminyltransferase subunit H conserved domain-containing protein n=1 Tax=Aphanomyces invadans TaxID=157072 RepID=A0A024TIW0_9STRA|nr:hypothetical protein, variant 1 [Aphanomyces invadans]ETV93983.1 hypothetical protein, variant 1 [Aphanomyces invadans]|eukprot:XP_008877185.1 hypothetical protein, variant 1 [Aphanomyces invadans]